MILLLFSVDKMIIDWVSILEIIVGVLIVIGKKCSVFK